MKFRGLRYWLNYNILEGISPPEISEQPLPQDVKSNLDLILEQIDLAKDFRVIDNLAKYYRTILESHSKNILAYVESLRMLSSHLASNTHYTPQPQNPGNGHRTAA